MSGSPDSPVLPIPLFLVALLLLACGSSDSQRGAGSERDGELGPFLSEHWRLPVPPQGPPPESFSEAEASLDPSLCGACHPQQFAEWQTSLHAAAHSPGLAGQLIEGELAGPFQVRNCLSCHAPLSEQQPYDVALAPNRSFDAGLRDQGIVCASCHVRSHRHFGPPRRSELPPLQEPVAHGGFEERDEYLESRFCAECHQFFDDPGINGKSVENTLFEWQASPQAAQGRQCQDCHMPDRAHLWRGIHDPEMVRSGVASELVEIDLADPLRAALVVANRDVGHAFPTYTTPRVFLALFQVDAQDRELPGTRVGAVIGRDLDLGNGIENSDTRVLPGESVKLDYRHPRAPKSAALIGRVEVDPDFHYRGMFPVLLRIYSERESRQLIEQAQLAIADSRYLLSEFRLELPAS